MSPSRHVEAVTIKRLADEVYSDIGERSRDPEAMLGWFQAHPAYRDPKHADHDAVSAIVRNTFEAKYGTEPAR